MNDPAAIEPEVPVVRLGVRGLDNLTNNMIGGGLYVLVAETPSARFPLLANSLGSALRDGLNCTVIVPANPESFIQRIQSFDRSITPDLIIDRRLDLFVMQDDFAKTVFRYGADGFVRELDYFEIPEHSFLVFDHADELLSLHDISLALDQVDILGKWLSQHQTTALLAFSRVSDAHADTINALMDNLTGIARLGGNKDGLELTFDYWQSPDGTVAAKNYRLSTLESGLYEASTQESVPESGAGEEIEATPEEADTDHHYFYMDPDLGSVAKVTPGVWQRVDTLLGMMHATRSSRSATAILRFQPDTNLRQLAETVHTLRLGMGRRAHIIVQEKLASLRYQNESLLLRLGVNLIVHKDVAPSRMPLMLESLKGQIFSRDVNIDFEEALTSVTPSPLRGYLLPARFVREVNVILERAGPLNIPYAMIIGQPAAETTMVDVLKRIKLTRTGDLFTADSNFCYIFLNACPQTVLLATVARIFGGSIETSLANPRFLIQRAEVDIELTGLAVAAERGGLPDYSAFTETPPESAPPENKGSEAKPAATAIPTGEPTLVRPMAVAPARIPEADATPVPAPTAPHVELLASRRHVQAVAPRTPPDASPSSRAAPPLAPAVAPGPKQTPAPANIAPAMLEARPAMPSFTDQIVAPVGDMSTVGTPLPIAGGRPLPMPASTGAVPVFGKMEAPRATRSTASAGAAIKPAPNMAVSDEDAGP